ncbi:MAG: hypothetical protein R6U32_01345 [Candidatus Woesearchaeota archaeon]
MDSKDNNGKGEGSGEFPESRIPAEGTLERGGTRDDTLDRDPFGPWALEEDSGSEGAAPNSEEMISPEFEERLTEISFRQNDAEKGMNYTANGGLYLHVNGTENILTGIHTKRDELNLIHFLRMWRLSQTDDPSAGLNRETSESESMFIQNIFTEVLGYDSGWISTQHNKYLRLKDPEYRKRDEFLQDYYQQFVNYMFDVDPEYRPMLFAPFLGKKRLDSLIERMPENKKEKIRGFLSEEGDSEMKETHWHLMNHIFPFYFIIHKDQLNDVYSKLERGNDSSLEARTLSRDREEGTSQVDIFLKNSVHYIMRDEEFSMTEGGIYFPFFRNRFGVRKEDEAGFYARMDRERQECDTMIWEVLNGPHNPMSVSMDKARRMMDVRERTYNLEKIFEPFKGMPISTEEVNLVVYAMENIIGIRGKTNIEKSFERHDLGGMSELEKLPLHDPPYIKELNIQRDYDDLGGIDYEGPL